MKSILGSAIICFLSTWAMAQNFGDTLTIKGFKYGSSVRDTLIQFPNDQTTYEKILLKYNMRCKNGLISNQSQPNLGCGEWDYSCNTYIVDSSKIENRPTTAPNYSIANFTGSVFPYVGQTIYDYYFFKQQPVVTNSIISENQYTITSGLANLGNFFSTDQHSGRSQVLITAAELISSGFSVGNIDGIALEIAGGNANANFLKLGIKHTTLTVLSSSNVATQGFTNVVNCNQTFTTGVNRLQFHTPFLWNGSDNIILDLSFTNSIPSSPLSVKGTTTSTVKCIAATNGYALDLSSYGFSSINTSSFSSISNQISVSFWCYGNADLLPAITTILYGYSSAPFDPQFRIHVPWSDSKVYFDAGFSAGSFDSVDKLANQQDFEGKWNHWTFTKNATNGTMKIYLNGALWHAATGKTKPINITTFLLGDDAGFFSPHKGKVSDLSVWNAELTLTDVQDWMNKNIDPSHPKYSNLVAYYKLNEGVGSTITDSKFNLTSQGQNFFWSYERGNLLFKNFTENMSMPNITLLRGNYSITTSTVLTMDSVARTPNTVKNFSVINNSSVVPMAHDQVTIASTQYLYEAKPIKIFDGDLSVQTGTQAVNAQGTILINDLIYYKRFPFFNELMSFVTPYGKGLDLGIKGKSWYFDVTDLAPLLRGPKRLYMGGGAFQEQMDLDFLFIVGTPPRKVLSFDQLWQGSELLGQAFIQQINSDAMYEPKVVGVLPNASAVKLRSTITGHGTHGEFHQNGGSITHYINVDGGANEHSWNITNECGSNPIYPQGGTWVYDRQGWCPGKASSLEEIDLTTYLQPNTTHTIDYNCSTPPIANGDYRYLCAHQLVTYGPVNHVLDAAIVEVINPSNKAAFSRENPICGSPKMIVRNTGSLTVSDLEIVYWLNNSSTKQTYTWTGSLPSMDTALITLPVSDLWQNDLQPNNNWFKVALKKVDGQIDDYSYNDHYYSMFELPSSITNSFTIEYKTNNYPLETSFELIDENLNVIANSATFTLSNTVYKTDLVLNGCFKLIVKDQGGDGLSWWANSAQGSGAIYLKDDQGNYVRNFNSDFGNGFEFSFTAGTALQVKEHTKRDIFKVYPNPSKGLITIEGNIEPQSVFYIYNSLGQLVHTFHWDAQSKAEMDLGFLSKGLYILKMVGKDGACVKTISIN